MSFSSCCLKTFTWNGTPTGTETTLAKNKTYVTGTNKKSAVLFIHDVFGWKYRNIRLLADHYAREADVTVYVPDFFGGWVVDWAAVEEGRWADVDLGTMVRDNSRAVRAPEMEACARALKSDEYGYERLGAVGFCYGAWGVCHLGSVEKKLVDVVSFGHPSWLTKEDIENLAVPVQILAPEFDEHSFSEEMKVFTVQTLLKKKSLPFEYVHFPGVEHGALVRGSEKQEREREAMAQAKNNVVAWFKLHLH